MRFWLVGLVVVFSTMAQARVFNIHAESFAAYFGGVYGSSFSNGLLAKAKDNGTRIATVTTDMSSMMGGEFGFVYSSPGINLKLGFEVLKPPDIKDAKGQNSAGTDVYNLNSDFSVATPKIGFEINAKQWMTSRLMIYAMAGSSTLVGRNAYTFTDAGVTDYGISNYTEDLRGTASLIDAGLAFEGLFVDTTTYVISAGYRQLNFEKITHNREVTTMPQGPVERSTTAKNADGTDRTLNLTSYYVGITFRFWVF